VDYVEAYNQYKAISTESEVDKQGKLKRTKLMAAVSATDAVVNQNTASQNGEILGPPVARVQTKDTMDGGIKKLEQMCEVVTKTMNQVAQALKSALPRQDARPSYKPRPNASPNGAQSSSGRTNGCRFNYPTPSGVQELCDRPRGTCFNCGSPDHWRNSCPHPPRQSNPATGSPSAGPSPAPKGLNSSNQGNC
jgi:hypothetical protein